MSRPLRITYENAWYHVMNRGAGKKNIFLNTNDRVGFLNILNEAVFQHEIEIHAFCLMDNHYHLLVKTPQANLSSAMRHINCIYTQRFNRCHNTDGALFRGRYKAIVIQEDSYILNVSRYIHLNPVEAKLVEHPKNFEFSSYKFYIEKCDGCNWLTKNELDGYFENTAQHENFILAGVDETTKCFYQKKKHPVVLGDEKFAKKLLDNINLKRIKNSRSDYNNTCPHPSCKQIIKLCQRHFNLTDHELFKIQRGQQNIEKQITIYCCRILAKESVTNLANIFGYSSHTAVSRILSATKGALINSTPLRKTLITIQVKASKLCQMTT